MKSNNYIYLDNNLIEIILELHSFFNGDVIKVKSWLKTENLNLGGSSPLTLCNAGRSNRVLEFITNAKGPESCDRK